MTTTSKTMMMMRNAIKSGCEDGEGINQDSNVHKRRQSLLPSSSLPPITLASYSQTHRERERERRNILLKNLENRRRRRLRHRLWLRQSDSNRITVIKGISSFFFLLLSSTTSFPAVWASSQGRRKSPLQVLDDKIRN